MTTAGGQQPKSVDCSGNLSKRTPTNKDKFAKARKEFNHAEKITKRRYNNKLKRELSDSSLSSKKWWNTVNTLSGKLPPNANSRMQRIPLLKFSDQQHTSRNG